MTKVRCTVCGDWWEGCYHTCRLTPSPPVPTGWQCPQCRQVNAPGVLSCPNCRPIYQSPFTWGGL